MRWLARVALASMCVLAACTDDEPTASSSSSSAPSESPSSDPPRAATLTFAGDRDLAGPVGEPSVTCSFPTTDGLQLAVLGDAAGGTASYRLGVSQDKVVVHIDATGPGGTFTERNFEGTGVSDFDPTRGATIDTTLTEAAPTPGTDIGTIGAVTGLEGSITCVDQSPGTSTLLITGDTATAQFDDTPLQPAIVECSFADSEVIVLGVAQAVTGQRVLMKVSLTTDGLGVEETLEPSGKTVFAGPPEAVTLTDTGGSANGDAVEKDSTTPHTLHVQGDATCGTPLR